MDVRLVHIDQEMRPRDADRVERRPEHLGAARQRPPAAPDRPVPAASWLSSTTACGGGGARGSARGSSGGRSVRPQTAPAASGSSAALGRLLLGVGWRPYAGRRRRRLEAPPPSERKGGRPPVRRNPSASGPCAL